MSREQVMMLGKSDVEFLAARVKRLCAHFGYPIPDKDDRFIVGVAPSLIGAILTKFELEKRNAPDLEQKAKDAARLDWMVRNNRWVVPVTEQRRGFCSTAPDAVRETWFELIGWLVDNAPNNTEPFNTMRDAIDAAMQESDHE